MIRYQISDKRNSLIIYLYHEMSSYLKSCNENALFLYFRIDINDIEVNDTNMFINSLYQNNRLSISKCTNGFQN